MSPPCWASDRAVSRRAVDAAIRAETDRVAGKARLAKVAIGGDSLGKRFGMAGQAPGVEVGGGCATYRMTAGAVLVSDRATVSIRDRIQRQDRVNHPVITTGMDLDHRTGLRFFNLIRAVYIRRKPGGLCRITGERRRRSTRGADDGPVIACCVLRVQQHRGVVRHGVYAGVDMPRQRNGKCNIFRVCAAACCAREGQRKCIRMFHSHRVDRDDLVAILQAFLDLVDRLQHEVRRQIGRRDRRLLQYINQVCGVNVHILQRD
jgi:hypothetical protein